jgi:hypothetical protein
MPFPLRFGQTYTLLGANGMPYPSTTPGTLGGNKRLRIYGKLDCPSALRWLEKGHYRQHRVFFKDEPTAQQAGYRPCGVCLQDAYRVWKSQQSNTLAFA